MCDASERQLEELLVASTGKTEHQEKVRGVKATGPHAHGVKVTIAHAGASMWWVHPKELLHPQMGHKESLKGGCSAQSHRKGQEGN